MHIQNRSFFPGFERSPCARRPKRWNHFPKSFGDSYDPRFSRDATVLCSVTTAGLIIFRNNMISCTVACHAIRLERLNYCLLVHKPKFVVMESSLAMYCICTNHKVELVSTDSHSSVSWWMTCAFSIKLIPLYTIFGLPEGHVNERRFTIDRSCKFKCKFEGQQNTQCLRMEGGCHLS